MDVSVTMMMKNAVKCDNNCDMQPLVNHHIFERILYSLDIPGSIPVWVWFEPQSAVSAFRDVLASWTMTLPLWLCWNILFVSSELLSMTCCSIEGYKSLCVGICSAIPCCGLSAVVGSRLIGGQCDSALFLWVYEFITRLQSNEGKWCDSASCPVSVLPVGCRVRVRLRLRLVAFTAGWGLYLVRAANCDDTDHHIFFISNQEKRPAEFKHIIKRRKRN
jgi:hypothetical protein